MTDIYDFRPEIFTLYKKQWEGIYKFIYNHLKITGNLKTNEEYYDFIKKQKPKMWNVCTDEAIKEFIWRSRMISHHELVYLPSKNTKN